jgi:hypothetical protein
MPTLNKNQVTSTSVLQVDITSAQTMLIISGIAIPEYATPANDGNTYLTPFTVDLGVYALEVLQSSVTVGLCDITSNNGAFQFSADEATVSLGGNGKVSLTLNLQVLGQSTLHRFSYQVVLLVKPAASKVKGSIKWNQDLWDLAQTSQGIPSSLKNQLTIAIVKLIPPPPGELGGSQETVKTGHCDTFTHAAHSGTCEAGFEIDGVPFGETLSVQVLTGSDFKAPSVDFLTVVQTSGPSSFELTPEHSSVTCDFLITTVTQPK